MTRTLSEPARLRLCQDSLVGLSVGDALGAQFFAPGRSPAELAAGRVPPPPWEWTDDTHMACSVVAQLRDRVGRIDADRLATDFADRCDPYRGYGPGAVVILHQIRDGRPWPEAAAAAFGGGSCGNGAAMRVAPLGAYHADDPDRAAAEADVSARVTHAHPEGVAGAVAVAVAAAYAGAARTAGVRPPASILLDMVAGHLAPGQVSDGLRRAVGLLGRSVAEAAYELGNGSRATAQDTVPFALWTAATHLTDYPAAITACVDAGGDVDTTGAIVGGVVAAHTGLADRPGIVAVPADWIAAREELPAWAVG